MELHDNKMKELLSYSKLELPFADFEENMMQKIQEYELKKKVAAKNRFFGHICFLLGILFGIAINYFTSAKITSFSNSYNFGNYIDLLSMFGYLVLIILFADRSLKLLEMDIKGLFK